MITLINISVTTSEDVTLTLLYNLEFLNTEKLWVIWQRFFNKLKYFLYRDNFSLKGLTMRFRAQQHKALCFILKSG